MPGIACLLLIAILSGCVHRHFPMVHPAPTSVPVSVARVRAENYFISALDYERRGLLHMAERFYEMAHELDPESSVLRNRLVNLYLQLSKYNQALVLIKGRRSSQDLPADKKRLLATVYFRMGQLQRAVDYLKELPSPSPEELYTLGLIYEMMGRHQQAVECYRLCYVKTSEPLGIGLKLGALHLKLGHLTSAESLFISLDQRFGGSPEILNGLALTSLMRGDTARGLDFLAVAADTDSSYLDALRLPAQIHLQRGDYEKALPLFSRLYKESDGSDLYGKTLAMLLYHTNRADSAITVLKSLLQKTLNDYELHFYLGLCLAATGKEQAATTELEKSLALRPDFSDGWHQLCFHLARQKKWDAAVVVAMRFQSAQPDQVGAWRTLAAVHAMSKEYARAEQALRKAIDLDSSDARTWFDLGSALERQKKNLHAADCFRTALRINPRYAAAANYLGYMWAEEGKLLDSAKTLLETALAIEPENGAYLDSYAWIFYRSGDYDQAYTYIRKALKHLDDDATIHEHLGDILLKRGEPAAAARAFEKSLELGPENPDMVREKLGRVKQDSRGRPERSR